MKGVLQIKAKFTCSNNIDKILYYNHLTTNIRHINNNYKIIILQLSASDATCGGNAERSGGLHPGHIAKALMLEHDDST